MADDKAPAPEGQPGATETKTEMKAEAKPGPKVETKATTAVTDPPDVGEITSPTDWPEDWRQKIADKDEKVLKYLERMGSPKDLWKSYGNAVRKISQLSQKGAADPFPAEGSEEDQTAWRARQGVPTKPDEYLKDFTLDGGIVIGEQDKPIVNEVLSALHKEHASPKVVQTALKAYYTQMEKASQELKQRDNGDIMAVRDAFRDEYGAEAPQQLAAAKAVIEMAPEPIREILASARLPNGRLLGNDPDAIRWLRDIGVEMNPAATVVPGAPGKSAKGVADRMAELQKLMGDRSSDYWKGPKSEALQAEYRKLAAAADKLDKRSAA